MLMVNGSYDDFSEDVMARVKSWVAEGGTVVATKGAATWAGGLLKSDGQGNTNEEWVSDSDSHSRGRRRALQQREPQGVWGLRRRTRCPANRRGHFPGRPRSHPPIGVRIRRRGPLGLPQRHPGSTPGREPL